MHENIGRSSLGSIPWYLSPQTHIHAREHRPLQVGLTPLIFIDSNTYTYMDENIDRSWLGLNPWYLSTQTHMYTFTRTSVAPDWAQTPDIYWLKHTHMLRTSVAPGWVQTLTFIDIYIHTCTCTRTSAAPGWALLLIFIDSYTHTCMRTSAAPCLAQTPDPPVFNPVNVPMMCSCVFILTHKTISIRRQ